MNDNFSYLKAKYGELWKSYIQHEFVLRMKEDPFREIVSDII